jgi:hypothetical protein
MSISSLVSCEVSVNGATARPVEFNTRCSLPFGTAVLQPCVGRGTGAEMLTINLDLPGGIHYVMQFSGMSIC